MVRPKKQYSLRKNGNYAQAYIDGEFAGSASIEELCLYMKGLRSAGRKRTTIINTQSSFIKERCEKDSKHTNKEKEEKQGRYI